MGVPELTTQTTDRRTFARILRAALRCQEMTLSLDRPPAIVGAHLLHVVFTGDGEKRGIWILADVDVLENRADNQATLRLKPRSGAQAAQLYALAQIACPGSIVPPEEQPIAVRVHSSEMPVRTDDPTTIASALANRGRIGLAAPLMPRGFETTLAGVGGDPLIGRTLGEHYRVDALVGAGGMTAVYRATHTELDRPFAVKFLHREHRTDASLVEGFRKAAREASRLDHPNIARLIDGGETEDGLFYVVVDFVKGRTLESMILHEGRMPIPRAASIGAQIARALAHAHDLGIVHAGLKPENVMLFDGHDEDMNAGEIVKVTDFAIADLVKNGSAVYTSPERARGDSVEPSSDLYALGLVLYEMSTGRVPFTADAREALLVQHIAEPPRAPSSLAADYDERLEEIVLQLLAKKPSERPTCAKDVATDLRRIAKAT
jgi:hypothetical protein